MGSSHIHVVHKKHKRAPDAHAAPLKKRALSDCATGSFYKSPVMGATVDSLQTLPITWDPTCLPGTKEIDLYLYSPGSASPRIHIWSKVAVSRGTYEAELKPRWWNATASQQLQIIIAPSGEAPFNSMSTFPGGPVFTATYTAPSNGSIPAAADTAQIENPVTTVNDLAKDTGMNPGKTAAAVILPLLFVGLCVGAFIKMRRSRGQEKRKEWAEKIDKRMSTISSDWKSVSAAGANAAIRNSIAVGNRNSSFSFGAIRPSSTFAVEGDDEKASMKQARSTTGVGLRNPASLTGTGERVSRVSFAPDTRVSRVSFADSRPSTDSRRTRAFHSAYIPPVPALPDSAAGDQEEEKSDISSDAEGRFSPRQAQGPLTLSPEDIRARIAGGKAGKTNPEGEFDEVMAALSMMRTGNDSSGDELLFSGAAAPAMPSPTHPKPMTSSPQSMSPLNSPVMSTMPMQPMPASVMSPDEMLRAYAERKKSMSMSTGKKGSLTSASISYPKPVATNSTGGSGRALYGATGVVSPTNTGNGVMAEAQDNVNTSGSEDPYGGYNLGMAASDLAYPTNAPPAYPFGHHPNGSIGVGSYGGAQYAIGDDDEADATTADVGMAGRGAYGAGGATYAGQHQVYQGTADHGYGYAN